MAKFWTPFLSPFFRPRPKIPKKWLKPAIDFGVLPELKKGPQKLVKKGSKKGVFGPCQLTHDETTVLARNRQLTCLKWPQTPCN